MKNALPNPGYGNIVPPVLTHVIIYFLQKGASTKEAESFYEHFNNADWTTLSGTPVRNWKALANEWIWDLQH